MTVDFVTRSAYWRSTGKHKYKITMWSGNPCFKHTATRWTVSWNQIHVSLLTSAVLWMQTMKRVRVMEDDCSLKQHHCCRHACTAYDSRCYYV